MSAGRPTDFTPELGTLICVLMSDGMSLREICRQFNGKPSLGTVLRWVAKGDLPESEEQYKIFCKQYARAEDARAQGIFDEIIEISDNAGGGERVKTKEMVGPDGRASGVKEVTTTRGDVVDRDRLRIDSRKWVLARMRPKKFGDKVDHTSSDGSLTPAPAQFIFEGVQPDADTDTQ